MGIMSDLGKQPIGKEEPRDGTSENLPTDLHERLVTAGLVPPGPKPRPICELELKRLSDDSTFAVRVILEDRARDRRKDEGED